MLVTIDGGTVELRLEDGSGSRVRMTAEGGSQYSVGVRGWSPDGRWVLLSDSAARLLLVTVEEPSTTWVLAQEFQDQAVITSG